MLTLTYTRVQTLNQNGDVLHQFEQTGSEILTDGVNNISERKKIYCSFDVETNEDETKQLILPGAKIYVNWALFLPVGIAYAFVGGIPATGFGLTIPESVYEAGEEGIEMHFYSNGNITPNSSKNLRCYFYFLTETSFAVELEYYMTSDEYGYMNGVSKSNEWRFISEGAGNQDTAIVPESVYNTTKELRLLTYILNKNDEPTVGHETVAEMQEHPLYHLQAESFNSVLYLEDASTGEELTELMLGRETSISARLYTENNTIDKFYARLIRIQDNPALNFIENYELIENDITDSNEDYNAFVGPFSVTRIEEDGYYELNFSIDPEYLSYGAKYRISIMAYDLGEAETYIGAETLGGIGPEINTTTTIPYCLNCAFVDYENPNEILLSASLYDIDNEYTGNFLTCCIEERMRTKLEVDYSNDRWKNNIDCRKTGFIADSATSNDIRVYLKAVQLDIYEEYTDAGLNGTVRNILDQKLIQRVATNTYNSNGPLISFAGENITLQYDFRNRHQANTPCIATTLDGVSYLPLQGNQYWGGKTIFIRWRLVFYYHDFPVPFMDNVDVIQKMVVKDYSNDVTLSQVSGSAFFCPDEEKCIQADIIFSNPEDYKPIVTAEIKDGPGLIGESEPYVPGILAQQTLQNIVHQDNDYTGGDARFCIYPFNFPMNFRYKFSVMAKKL